MTAARSSRVIGRGTLSLTRQLTENWRSLDHRGNRHCHAALEQRLRRAGGMTGSDMADSFLSRHPRMHQHAGIAVTRHHALGAAVSNEIDAVEVEHRAERLIPGLAAPDLQVPVEIEIAVTSDAGKYAVFAIDVSFDVLDARARIEYTIAPLQRLDFIQPGRQFCHREVHKIGAVTIDERRRAERLPPRVGEGHRIESQIAEQRR